MKIETHRPRKFARIPLDRQVKVDFIEDSFYSKVKNLSLAGMFIVGDFHNHEGNYCLIDMYKEDLSTDLSLRAAARVVRKNDKGLAVEFVSMPFSSYKFLQSTLPRNGNYPFKIADNLPNSATENMQVNN